MVVWTASIDRNKTRLQGRRIPKSISVDSPRLSEIESAAKSLSLDFGPRPGASMPRSWWEKSGYLTVDRGNSSRTEILKNIAKQIAKLRQAKKD